LATETEPTTADIVDSGKRGRTQPADLAELPSIPRLGNRGKCAAVFLRESHLPQRLCVSPPAEIDSEDHLDQRQGLGSM